MTCDESHTKLSQCVDLEKIGISGDCDPSKNTAGVICAVIDSQPNETTSPGMTNVVIIIILPKVEQSMNIVSIFTC